MHNRQFLCKSCAVIENFKLAATRAKAFCGKRFFVHGIAVFKTRFKLRKTHHKRFFLHAYKTMLMPSPALLDLFYKIAYSGAYAVPRARGLPFSATAGISAAF